jgi:hypothetical protein
MHRVRTTILMFCAGYPLRQTLWVNNLGKLKKDNLNDLTQMRNYLIFT